MRVAPFALLGLLSFASVPVLASPAAQACDRTMAEVDEARLFELLGDRRNHGPRKRMAARRSRLDQPAEATRFASDSSISVTTIVVSFS